MALDPESIQATLQQAITGLTVQLEEGVLVIPAEKLSAVARFLKENQSIRLDYLSNLAAVDYPPEHLAVAYHFFSIQKREGPLALKVLLPRENPVVDSLTPIWRSAEYQEREAYDLYGVQFQGHPDLRRILMWEGFDGYPMRKDYKIEEQDILEDAAEHA